MAALLALVATTLTSFLPILNKRLLRDARPARRNPAAHPVLGHFFAWEHSVLLYGASAPRRWHLCRSAGGFRAPQLGSHAAFDHRARACRCVAGQPPAHLQSCLYA